MFFSSTKSEKECGTGFSWRWGRGGGDPIMYTHVNKCKNDKIKNV
jgi:hypothetical protein